MRKNRFLLLAMLLIGILVFKMDVYADCQLGSSCHYISFYTYDKDGNQIENELGTYVTLYTNPGETAKIQLKFGGNKEEITKLPIPEKENCKFDGWYYDESFTQKVEGNEISKLKLNTEGYNALYGKFIEKKDDNISLYVGIGAAVIGLSTLIIVIAVNKKNKLYNK